MDKLLDSVNSPADIKGLSIEQLRQLCAEIREYMVDCCSRNPGHLGASLGAVELIVGVHYVFDTPSDKLVFDVGHQAYAHKIITGRREAFARARTKGGISGFPKMSESPYDAFGAGHASTSISAALGFAEAAKLRGTNERAIAFIGDGALTGGLAMEGLNNAGNSGSDLLIILNDNNMSISENVGGTASVLQTMRARPGYINFKRWYRDVFSRLPALYRFNHKIKEWLKARLLPDNMFSEMGLYYLGPVDGHDVVRLETAIRYARDVRVPVLLHVLTKKGKGCEYTEKDPEKYHGVSAFDVQTGELPAPGACFSSVFGDTLCMLASEDDRVVGITEIGRGVV